MFYDSLPDDCDLIGPKGILVQFILLLLVFTAVKIKHHYERPRRIIKLFFMDGTKQLVSNGMLHVVNVYISVVLGTGKHKDNDQCGM